MKKTQIIMAITLCVALGAGAASLPWTEDFSSGSIPSNMELGAPCNTTGTNHVSFAGGVATWEDTLIFRQLLRTTETDYSTNDFTFEATCIFDGDANVYSTAIIGMGDGDVGDTGSGYDWMPLAPQVSAFLEPDQSVSENFYPTVDNAPAKHLGAITGSRASTTNRLRMTWDASESNAVFYLDADYAGGDFEMDYVTTYTYDGFTNTTAVSLFVGAGNGTIFDDLSVVAGIWEPPGTDPASIPSWSEDFEGLSALPSYMEIGPSATPGTITVVNDQVEWDTASFRQLVRTAGTAGGANYERYNAANFTFEATVTINGGDAFGVAVFGMGAGGINAYMPTGTSVGLYVGSTGWPHLKVAVDGAFDETNALENVIIADETHRLRMEWDATAEVATFSVDTNYTGGALVADFTLVGTNTGFFSESDARLFFGGGNGVVFDDVSVNNPAWVPPGQATILSLSPVSGGSVVKMVVDAPGWKGAYYPVAETDLVTGGSWSNRVPHSNNEAGPFVPDTNLAYSATDASGTNEVIYLQSGDAKKFFRIITEE